jgi:hypothetical protein
LTTQDEQVVGFARLIRPGKLPLKTIVDIEGPPWGVDGVAATAEAGIDLTRTWDFTTVGVRHKVLGAAGTSVAAQVLYHAAGEVTMANGSEWVLAIADSRVRTLGRISGLFLRGIPRTGPAEYMGSPACLPIYTHVKSTFVEQSHVDPKAYQWGTSGRGAEHLFDEITLPDRQDLVVPPVSA